MDQEASQPATKADVKDAVVLLRGGLQEGMNTLRSEITASADRLALEFLKWGAGIQRTLDADLAETRGIREQMLKAYEDTTFKGKMFYEKALTHGDMIQDHGFQLQDHERRLKMLEDVPLRPEGGQP
ncbi:MAG: hypothetical protein HZB91_06425 [Elusimicrobia bacterium]|nr:hypothetical protein [Elusimicrobiota bacterium]